MVAVALGIPRTDRTQFLSWALVTCCDHLPGVFSSRGTLPGSPVHCLSRVGGEGDPGALSVEAWSSRPQQGCPASDSAASPLPMLTHRPYGPLVRLGHPQMMTSFILIDRYLPLEIQEQPGYNYVLFSKTRE